MDPRSVQLACIRIANYIDGVEDPSRQAVITDLNFLIAAVENQAGLEDFPSIGKIPGIGPLLMKKYPDLYEAYMKKQLIDRKKESLKEANDLEPKLKAELSKGPQKANLKSILDEDKGGAELARSIVKYIQKNRREFKALGYDRVDNLFSLNLNDEQKVKQSLIDASLGMDVDKKYAFLSLLATKLGFIFQSIDQDIKTVDKGEESAAERIEEEAQRVGVPRNIDTDNPKNLGNVLSPNQPTKTESLSAAREAQEVRDILNKNRADTRMREFSGNENLVNLVNKGLEDTRRSFNKFYNLYRAKGSTPDLKDKALKELEKTLEDAVIKKPVKIEIIDSLKKVYKALEDKELPESFERLRRKFGTDDEEDDDGPDVQQESQVSEVKSSIPPSRVDEFKSYLEGQLVRSAKKPYVSLQNAIMKFTKFKDEDKGKPEAILIMKEAAEALKAMDYYIRQPLASEDGFFNAPTDTSRESFLIRCEEFKKKIFPGSRKKGYAFVKSIDSAVDEIKKTASEAWDRYSEES